MHEEFLEIEEGTSKKSQLEASGGANGKAKLISLDGKEEPAREEIKGILKDKEEEVQYDERVCL